jgi:F5/8 type C domain
VGSIATAEGGVAETAHTFLFNNVARHSRGNGILVDTQFERSVENYFSQTVLSENGRDINSHPSNGAAPPEFFNPPPAVDFALRQPITASSSAPGSSPDAAVDGLAFTRWSPDGEPRSSLDIDLGSAVAFGRILLKRSPALALVLADFQVSDDGVDFTDLRGVGRRLLLSPVSNMAFPPVQARFLRVKLWTVVGGPLGIEEISVHPE